MYNVKAAILCIKPSPVAVLPFQLLADCIKRLTVAYVRVCTVPNLARPSRCRGTYLGILYPPKVAHFPSSTKQKFIRVVIQKLQDALAVYIKINLIKCTPYFTASFKRKGRISQ
jgi:hypothetical protein